MSTPQVWIGCLACYNAGRLVGQWFDALEAGSVTVKRVHDNGDRVPRELDGIHEELWVMDHEGFDGALSGECSPATAQTIAERMAELDAAGVPAAAGAAWLANQNETLESAPADYIEQAHDAYVGEWDSREDYAQDLAEELGAVPSEHTWPTSYIDWQRAARDLFMDYEDHPAPGGRIYVFRVS